MFELLTALIVVVVAMAILHTYWHSRDVFHPVMFIGPMMVFLYAWMPSKLNETGGLDGFFQTDQLVSIQTMNLLGVVCFLVGCLSMGVNAQIAKTSSKAETGVSPSTLLAGGAILGAIGLAAWTLTIVHVGGFTAAFSTSYSGGWDDNGYIRDASLLMFPAFLLILASAFRGGFGFLKCSLIILFLTPWMVQAAFTARRGPTFMIAVLIAMGWYLNRQKRPSLIITFAAGGALGLLLLFLVSNRGSIHLGSDDELTTEVTGIVETADAGNEFVYGTGSVLSAAQRNSYYFGRRYLAQLIVRPIPSVIWPTKYEDFGLAELTHNAGTGEGFEETLGWQGAEGSAPGVVADLWMEFSWGYLPAIFLIGRLYGYAWNRALSDGGRWVPQFVILSALSIYLVMQTMEAVIFRLLILSIPMHLVWQVAEARAARAIGAMRGVSLSDALIKSQWATGGANVSH